MVVVAGGAGIGRLPDYLAAPAVAAGKLVRVLPRLEGELIDIHALYPSHRSLSAKVRVFIDALVTHIKSVRADLDG
jgi:DNA-binding transcriptional LysR family regulator